MIINNNQMKRIFDEFSYQVSAKFYRKMPRDNWRKIKTAIEENRMFILNLPGKAYLTFAETCDGKPRTTMSFEFHDESFGDFLYDLFWDEKEGEIILCTNDYLDKTLWTSTSPSQNSGDTEDKYIKNIDNNKEIVNNFKLVDEIVKQGTEYIASSKDVQEALEMVKKAASGYYDKVKPVAFITPSMDTGTNQATSTTTSTTITIGDRDTTATTTTKATINAGDYNTCIGTAIDGYTITSSTSGTISLVENIEDTARKIFNEEWNKRKENNKMKFSNFDFGPCVNDNVRMSMYGIAIKNAAGTYVSYDATSGEIIDVDVFNFDGGKYMFKMPVAIKDVKVGDVIIHNRTPMFVVGFAEGTGDLIVVDIRAGEKKTIMPIRNMFHFDFVTKIVSLFDMTGMAQPSVDMPFGNMLPLMLMSDDNKDMDMKDILMMSTLANGGNMGNMNPMMLYFLASNEDGDTSMKDMLLPMMLLSNQQK